ncbi:MAG: hypothetical protein KBT34_04235 [Prevotella sp.]|nr:hypothetical protein [Candidatus Prevotella equi]
MKTIIIFLISFVFLLFIGNYQSPLNEYLWGDSAVYHIMGKSWLEGHIIYKELFDNKGPYLYIVHAVGSFLGMGKWGMFLWETINLSVALLLMYEIGKLLVKNIKKIWLAICLTLCFFVATIGEGNLSEEWCLNAQLLPLYLFVKYSNGDKKEHPYLYTLIYGLCFGFISFLRINNGCVNVGIVIGLLVLFLVNKRYKEILFHGCVFLMGLCITILPMVAYFTYHNSLNEMLHGTFLYNLNYKESYMELSTGLIIKNLVMIIPVVLIGVLCAMKNDKEYKTIISYMMIPLAFIYTYTLYACWGFNHYFTNLLPCIFLAIILCLNTDWEKMIKFFIICLCFIPYSENFTKCIAKNIILDVVYKNDYLYSKIGDVSGMPHRDENERLRKIMDVIPKGERNSIYMYNAYLTQPLFLIADKMPIGKYFYLHNTIMRVDKKVEEEVKTFFYQDKPKWILMDCSQDDFFDSSVCDNYTLVMDKKQTGIGVDIYKMK